ncbi:MAG: DNA repair protein RadC [Gemmatimonadaceae bacterium]|jgi:DNA repair protein RadC|nr:DNA repair protein RadC [Gemmatimonadaceae bacterium]
MSDVMIDPPLHRPRERLQHAGARSLTSAELLAVVVGSGSVGYPALQIGEGLLHRVDGALSRLAALPVGVLAAVPGVGRARASAVAAALELGRRLAVETAAEAPTLRDPAAVAACFAPRLAGLPVEEFHVVHVDAKHRLWRDVVVSRGLLNASLVHPREVFREAIADRAAAVVLVHNHPSGDPTPSPEDRLVTGQLVAAGRILDIPVLDHVIVGRGRFLSFAEAGLL